MNKPFINYWDTPMQNRIDRGVTARFMNALINKEIIKNETRTNKNKRGDKRTVAR